MSKNSTFPKRQKGYSSSASTIPGPLFSNARVFSSPVVFAIARRASDAISSAFLTRVPPALSAMGSRRCIVHAPKRSAFADRISSRAIEVAIGIAAYPNPGFCGRGVEAGSHAFARCSAESREGVGDAEDAVFDLRDGLDATGLGEGHFHLGIGIRSAQDTERCREEDGYSHALGLSPYVIQITQESCVL
jgi:hypothetical protein